MKGTFWSDAYRPFFTFAAAWGVTFLGLWARALSGGTPISPTDHAQTMIWGVLGSGVLGFALTAYPRQNGAPPPGRPFLVVLIGTQMLAQGALAASWFGAPTVNLATALGAAVWAMALAFVTPIAVASLRKGWDGTTAAVPVSFAAALLGFGIVRLGPDPRLGLDVGMHAFLVLLAVALLDRLLPFFSSRLPGFDGLRRPHFVPLLIGALGLRLVLRAHPEVPDLLVAAVLLRQWTGWRPLAGLRDPMVAVLHLGVAWLIVGYLVEGLSLQAFPSLPAHLWMIGGLGTLLVGVSMRVTMGHGGQPMRMGKVGLSVVLLVQIAAMTRAVPMHLVSAGFFAAAFLVWLARFGPMTLRR